MTFARPFAYNPDGRISGTQQVGLLSVGFPKSGFTDTPQYWNGPDEDLGYVIAAPVSGNTQPTPLSGVTASVGFYRTSTFDDNEFVSLSEIVSNEYDNPQTFTSATDASVWLTTNGFWNSFTPSEYYDVTIEQSDIDNAIGNTEPGMANNTVYVEYQDCNNQTTLALYTVAGTYTNSICVAKTSTPSMFYYNFNSVVSGFSFLSGTNVHCCT
jgi:hypothetical protein